MAGVGEAKRMQAVRVNQGSEHFFRLKINYTSLLFKLLEQFFFTICNWAIKQGILERLFYSNTSKQRN